MNIMQDSGVNVVVQDMNITTYFLLLHLRKGGNLIEGFLPYFLVAQFSFLVPGKIKRG